MPDGSFFDTTWLIVMRQLAQFSVSAYGVRANGVGDRTKGTPGA